MGVLVKCPYCHSNEHANLHAKKFMCTTCGRESILCGKQEGGLRLVKVKK